MQLRFLQYFVAIARERHFGRAAEACQVSQPTLSAGLVALEQMLGERLVERDRRFIDLTSQGHAILHYAQQMIADEAAIRAALNAESGGLRGIARLGVIPAAMPAVGYVVAAMTAAHPEVRIGVSSMTSREIERALLARDIDAGLTYLKSEPLAQVRSVPLYAERFVAVTARSSALARRGEASLADIVAQRLCLLHQGMQNRRILDGHLRALGLSAAPVATADSYVALLSMVSVGGLDAIITDSHAALVAAHPDLVTVPIADPMGPNEVGLVISDRTPLPPLAAGLYAIASTLELSTS
jgi:DNA-binding transcriptional LysR family regulator